MNRTRWLRAMLPAGLAATLGLMAVACSNESLDDVDPVQSVDTVNVVDNGFEPRVIEVQQGAEVTWTWDKAERPHDVSGDGFSSQVMEAGTFTFVFDDEGSFDYRCTLHRDMTGRVIVTAADGGEAR